MSRFTDDGEEGGIPYALWQANAMRALSGQRGQQALRDLEAALLALPEPRLIDSSLARKGEVCTVGALVLHRRMTAGEERAAILAQLEALAPPHCECSHPESDHEDGTGHCTRVYFGGNACSCSRFTFDPSGGEDYGMVTADAGQSVGLTMTLAWELAWLNDERFSKSTPEERHAKVLAWVREAMIEQAVA